MEIDILYIILGLLLGFFIIYATSSPPAYILKYPTIDNIKNTTYVDENGVCYKYYAKKLHCPNSITN